MKPIYVTYTRILHNGTTARFAVECENIGQVMEAAYYLNSRANVKNIRINKSGRKLPVESAIFPYHEYMSNK